ncbi:MAG: class I SAM-dependent rRNA methyltransferase [Saprospiraceae bacterium]
MMPLGELSIITLHSQKTQSLLRRHPWIFSGAIKHLPKEVSDGDLVYLQDEKSLRLGFGHFQAGSIAVRMLSFGNAAYSPDFWQSTVRNAYNLRKMLGLIDNPECTAYRLIHGEGDGLPGLIVDIYGHLAIIQCHSTGMAQFIENIVEALQSVLTDRVQHIYNKSNDTLPLNYTGHREGQLLGNLNSSRITETKIQFDINAQTGQKTGFFLDQRENRKLLLQYAAGKNILNAFCYTGGFSLYALAAGANSVTSIDSSSRALEQLDSNLSLNHFEGSLHKSVCGDVIPYLNQMDHGEFDMIILDPPAFAKSLNKRHNAVQAYKRINAAAIKKLNSSGLLFTFSCSQVIDDALFYNTITAAGIESGRKLSVIHKLSQGPDHPVNLFHPEGHYLKGLVLEVE